MAETVGSLIDKICITELKIFHMQEQSARSDAAESHREFCLERTGILRRQKEDLVEELSALFHSWHTGRWKPKIYRQFKMYNDPAFKITTPKPTSPSMGEGVFFSGRLLRLRVPLGFVLAAWYLFVARVTVPLFLAVCCVLVVFGCFLRSWAAGYLLKGKRVAVGGPYSYIRNPLYAGSFLIGLGCCVALIQSPLPLSVWIFWFIFLFGFAGIYRSKTLAEEVELRSGLGQPYVDYAAKVPAFLPVRGRVSGIGRQKFSWEIYRRNREYQCLLGSAAILVFLFLRGRIGI